ncbi:MAG: sigma-54 dependent transcriptional regulator [Proteobacteria bacterium]|nr:sigma-54 dependent transcriptional regulator [Pseudomonadota bacterium]MBU4294616.1 sigma-54 dependent transcriptional regulator [Pseudomonadota bacterium]MCG2745992.1 sigma-54 dependent transcriptional regulator [Desulfobulbaceae bacterium]
MKKDRRILVIDDEQAFCRMLDLVLKDNGYQVRIETNSARAVEQFQAGSADLVITDVKMPVLDGLGVLRGIKAKDAAVPVLMMTAHATVDMSIRALRDGAFDMLIKPFEPDELLHRVANALKQSDLIEENKELRQELAQGQFPDIIGQDKELRAVLDTAHKLAQRDISVLISGESGTGKELVARAIHEHSRRQGQRFVAINCGALPETLLESELFGHRKGAFTGADQEKKGLLETADQGTLLLDEVGNLPIRVQKTLLRFLQEREFYRVGESQPTRVDVRILSATNADLKDQMEQGRFREDLYFRLAMVNLHLPALRQRRTDIPLLAQHFIEAQNDRFTSKVRGIAPQAMEILLQYEWPGNVRELLNVIDAGLAIESGEMLSAEVISRLLQIAEQKESLPPTDADYSVALARFEQGYFANLLQQSAGNVETAAKKAGVNLATFYRKIKKYALRS